MPFQRQAKLRNKRKDIVNGEWDYFRKYGCQGWSRKTSVK